MTDSRIVNIMKSIINIIQSRSLVSIRICLSVLLLLLLISQAQGQQFPVRTTTMITPPYSVYLSDYISPESNSLQLILQLRDFEELEYRARLRLTIEGQGVTIRTKNNYRPAPLIIRGGGAETFDGYDLRNYFNPDNLDFAGITRADFIQSGKLPEGFYTFTFEVLDYDRGVVVSNPGIANAWLVLNDPPLINLPFNGDKVIASDPQNIFFSWTPRHTASPNSAFSTEYELTLVELWPANRNPNDAILASNPIYKTTLSTTSLNYGITEPILIPGRQYAYRVRAFDTNGRDLFKNNGYSEVFVFQFGDKCLAPSEMEITTLEPNRARLSWTGQEIHTEYNLRYRKSGSTEWFDYNTFLNNQIVPDLQPATTYEYQVRGKCNTLIGDYSAIAEFTTTEIEETQFVCGSDIPPVELDTNPLDIPLKPGDEVKTSDFTVRITEVEGDADNGYQGTGRAQIPYFEFASMEVKFSSIKVNQEYRVYEGDMITVYDPNSIFVLDTTRDDELNDEEDPDEEEDGNGEDTGGDAGSGDADAAVDTVTVDSPVVDVQIDPDTGEITLLLKDGGVQPVNPDDGEEVLIVDGDGKEIRIDGDGNVTGLGGSGEGGPGSNPLVSNDSLSYSIGPFSIVFEQQPQAISTSDGYCKYQDLPAAVSISFSDPGINANYRRQLEGALVSFEQHCENGDYRDFEIRWKNDGSEVGIGKVGLVDGFLKEAAIDINASGQISGSLDLRAAVVSDDLIDELYRVKKREYGNFSFSYLGTTTAEGAFDLTEIDELEIELVKNGIKIATSSEFSFGIDGKYSGRFESVEGSSASYQNEYYKVTVDGLNVSIVYDLATGFNFDGAISGKITNMKGMQGDITFNVQYLNEEITTEITTGELSAFGMQLNNMELKADFTRKLELDRITGKFEARHPEFSAGLAVSEFEFTHEGLQQFDASADFTYTYDGKEIEFLLSSCTYDALQNKIMLDALAQTKDPENGTELVVEVRGFTIDATGKIEIGEFSAESVADLVMGPLIITNLKLESKAGFEGEPVGGKKVRRFTGTASAKLKAIQPDGEAAMIELGELAIDYHRFDEETDKSFYKGYLGWKGEQQFLEAWGISGQLKEAKIWIDREGKVSGEMIMNASLQEDKNIAGVFNLKSGLNGEMTYKYLAQKNFTGVFDLTNLSNINVGLVKGGKEIASLQNGRFTGERTFTGRLTAAPGAKFESNGFDLTVDNINLEASYNFDDNKVKFISGSGQLTVSEIAGMQTGTVSVSLEALGDELLRAGVATSETNIQAFGFGISPGSLKAEITTDFDLKRIYGDQIRATHNAFDSEVEIEEFLIEEGKLTAIRAYGGVVYKGFNFDIEEAIYENNLLSIDAAMKLNLTGTQGAFAVDDFAIDRQGTVSISGVDGSLRKSGRYNIDFDAAFEETSLSGNFKGKIDPIGLSVEGNLDIGRQTDGGTSYHFAYLNLKAGVGVGLPLGPTGLKLDKVGGKAGFNYRLTYDAGSKSFSGSPRNKTYLLGLTMGVSDLTNSIAVEGSPTIQFGNDEFDFNLEGNLSIPKNKPIISSDIRLQYSYPAKTLNGDFTTNMRLPAATGKIFNASFPVSFRVSDGTWAVRGTNINGKLLDLIDFGGSFLFDGKVDPWRVNNIGLNGYLNFDYERDFRLKALGEFEVGLYVNANFAANARVEVNENGLAGEFSGRVTGELRADARFFFINFGVSANVDAAAKVGYNSQYGGYMESTGTFRFKDFDFSFPVDLGYRFDKNNKDTYTFDPDDPASGASTFGRVEGDVLVIRDEDIRRVTASSSGGVNIKAFENIKKVKLNNVTVNLPSHLRIKAVGDDKVFIPGFCFVAGTKVQTASGETRNIEEIATGDLVMSYLHKNNQKQEAKVTDLMKKQADRLIRVRINGEEFLSTPNHPYYANGAYTEAGDLIAGDSVLSMTGYYSVIERIEVIDTVVTVYNFTVEGNHNYFIGNGGYLVHNDCNFIKINQAVTKRKEQALNYKLIDYYAEARGRNATQRKNLNAKVAAMEEVYIVNFVRDFGDSPKLDRFFREPTLVDYWKRIAGTTYRRDMEYLDFVKEIVAKRLTVQSDDKKIRVKKGSWTVAWIASNINAAQGKKGNWNDFLNIYPAMKNKQYDVKGYIFHTDERGRVKRVTGTLKKMPSGKTSEDYRHDSQQLASVNKKNGGSNDDGGHLFAARFTGPGEQINYVPMHQSINRNGSWYQMEKLWADAMKAGKTVAIDVTINYSGTSARPTSFQVSYSINGVRQQSKRITNPR